MAVDTVAGFWMAYKEETAYASGSGSTALDQTALEQGDLSPVDRVISCVVSPYNVPEREEEWDLGSGLEPSYVLDLRRNPGEITLTCYLQTDDFYDYALTGNTLGAIPTSLCLHIDNGIVEQDFFGCVIKSWSCKGVTGGRTEQTIVFMFRDVGDGGALSKVAYNSTAPSVHKNVSYTIDSKTSALTYGSEITQTITIGMWEDEAYALGDEKIQLPVVKERNVEIEITYKSRDSNTWGAGNNAVATADELNSASYFNASIVWFTTLTSTMTNVRLVETNSGDRAEHGLITHTAKFQRGVGFTIA